MDSQTQNEFLNLIGDDLNEEFHKGKLELEMALNILEEDDCTQIVNNLSAFFDRVAPE